MCAVRRSLASLGALLCGCSLFVDADLDQLGPSIDIAVDCSTIDSCDDGVPCTNDVCDEDRGGCVHEPDDALCGPDQTCDVNDGCTGGDSPCAGDEECVDPQGCTIGACEDDRCTWSPLDADGDGSAACDDCDDGNGQVRPGLTEVCGNGADDDCAGGADRDDPTCQNVGCGHELVIQGRGEVEGQVRGKSDLMSERCERGTGPEIVVDLVIAEPSDLVISTEGSDFDTVLYVREGCDGEELACADNRSQARGWLDSRLFLQGVPPGTYTIVVDSNERGGQFHLRVDREDPRGATCDRPLDITGGGTVVGQTEGGDADQGASCSEPTGPAAAFQFQLPEFSEVTITSEESDFDLVQDVVRDECGGDTAPNGCLDSTAAGEVFRGGLGDGRWVVVLDGFQEQSGRYVLRFFP